MRFVFPGEQAAFFCSWVLIVSAHLAFEHPFLQAGSRAALYGADGNEEDGCRRKGETEEHCEPIGPAEQSEMIPTSRRRLSVASQHFAGRRHVLSSGAKRGLALGGSLIPPIGPCTDRCSRTRDLRRKMPRPPPNRLAASTGTMPSRIHPPRTAFRRGPCPSASPLPYGAHS